ncbi:putative glycoside hydrolase [Clostridiaceae bacterium OttesenSCG-928-D20]|nr:putative glycoside hydrolase [Clostridiaceae bacterium OttesenSCG-928-D20]
MSNITPKDIYRGRKPYKKPLMIILGLFGFLLVSAVAVFFYMGQYVTYSQDGVSLDLPILSSPQPSAETDGGNSSLLEAPAEIVYETPSFDDVVPKTEAGLERIRAVYVPAEKLSAESIDEAASRISSENLSAMILQLKPKSGYFAYLSNVPTVSGYLINGVYDIREKLTELKEKDIWLIAELSVCIDAEMASRNPTIALKDITGKSYKDSEGTWLDPYNRKVREYIVSVIAELSAIGFDEVLLSAVAHPEEESSLIYSQQKSNVADVNTCVKSLALKLSEEAEGLGLVVSARYEGMNGQDLEFFY